MANDARLQIVAYCCEHCAYAAADLAGGLRMQYPPAIKIVQIPCTGRIDAPRIGGSGAPIDHVVYMRRFAAGALLSERLAAGRLDWVLEECEAGEVSSIRGGNSCLDPVVAKQCLDARREAFADCQFRPRRGRIQGGGQIGEVRPLPPAAGGPRGHRFPVRRR